MFSLKNFNWVFFLNIFLILVLGSITVFSTNQAVFTTHLVYISLSLLAFFFCSLIDFRLTESFYFFAYLASVILLILPVFFGVLSRGAIRWIQLGSATIQPSELAKPLLTVFLAKYWAEKKFNLRHFFISIFWILLPLFLIFRQPDLGSTLVVVSIFLGIIFATDINWKQIIILVLVSLMFVPFGWLTLKDYQKQRLEHFLNPSSDPLGSGYNIIQAVITVGSGGLLGKGLGRGSQSHLAFLPERHTDFIFGSFAEEFGLLGTLFLFGLYFFLFKNILDVAKTIKTQYAYNYCLGLFFSLFFQTLVNIGMNLGIMPITGITLPLFSSGGSSLVATMISLGIFSSISKTTFRKDSLEIGKVNEVL